MHRKLRSRDDEIPAVSMSGEHRKTGFFSSRSGWDQRLKVFVNEREPTVNWFFVHDGKPEGAGYFVGYEQQEQSAGRFHRPVRFSLRSRAGRRLDSRATAETRRARRRSRSIRGAVRVRPTRSLGCAAALGLCAIRKPTATGRPRRADGHDRL